MDKGTITEIERCLRLHSGYKGDFSKDFSSCSCHLGKRFYPNHPCGIGWSRLLNDYYQAVGVSNLDAAFARLHRIDSE